MFRNCRDGKAGAVRSTLVNNAQQRSSKGQDMKRILTPTAALALIFTLAASVAVAQGPRGAAGLFERLDTNQDGQITRAEAEAHRDARFVAADTDADGFLTAEEILAQWRNRTSGGVPSRRIAHIIDRLDADDDGRLSAAEMPGRRPNHITLFDRIDTNGDNVITRAEATSAHDLNRLGKRGR